MVGDREAHDRCERNDNARVLAKQDVYDRHVGHGKNYAQFIVRYQEQRPDIYGHDQSLIAPGDHEISSRLTAQQQPERERRHAKGDCRIEMIALHSVDAEACTEDEEHAQQPTGHRNNAEQFELEGAVFLAIGERHFAEDKGGKPRLDLWCK